MITSKDWAQKAASKIAELWPAPEHGKGDCYLTDEQRKNIADHLAALITANEPRCETCRFWLQDGRDFGLCRMSSIDETFLDLPPVEQRLFTSRDLRAVTTQAHFGCVQWEAK